MVDKKTTDENSEFWQMERAYEAMREAEKSTGGPAFPTKWRDGMSLRDYFAAAALHVGLSDTAERWELDRWFGRDAVGIRREQIMSHRAYDFADAMLEARKREASK